MLEMASWRIYRKGGSNKISDGDELLLWFDLVLLFGDSVEF